ncbi:retrovirus-related pol polyprotein from transposon TNT 1-94 [Tanacetum coccineum]
MYRRYLAGLSLRSYSYQNMAFCLDCVRSLTHGHHRSVGSSLLTDTYESYRIADVVDVLVLIYLRELKYYGGLGRSGGWGGGVEDLWSEKSLTILLPKSTFFPTGSGSGIECFLLEADREDRLGRKRCTKRFLKKSIANLDEEQEAEMLRKKTTRFHHWVPEKKGHTYGHHVGMSSLEPREESSNWPLDLEICMTDQSTNNLSDEDFLPLNRYPVLLFSGIPAITTLCRRRKIFINGCDNSTTRFVTKLYEMAEVKVSLKNHPTFLGGAFEYSSIADPISLSVDTEKTFTCNGIIERYKARLVAKGFTQKEWIDYTETFAPVIHHNWFIKQLDINNAFLHGDLHEEVYMTIPQGYSKQLPPNTICKLTKSLYRLKQANRQMFHKLTTFLLTIGFQQSYADTSLFTLSQGSHFTALLLYFDDILLVGNHQRVINSIKDLGPPHYYLGIEILKNAHGLVISQWKYALELLRCGNVLNDKPISTPLDLIQSLNLTYGEHLLDPYLYKTLVVKLIYLTITRPDISFVAHLLSKFSQEPRTPYMKDFLKVLRYIKLCPRQGLHFPTTNNLQLTAYCDSDWASCPITRRSVT